MKTTMVPAQVTTIEDKIAGSLSLSQLLLLCTPVFSGSIIYVVFPPMLKLTVFKVGISGLLLLTFTVLALRVKGMLILQWLIVILRYNLRPRYFVFDKNDSYLRNPLLPAPLQPVGSEAKSRQVRKIPKLPKIPVPEMVRLESVIADPRAKLHFRSDKKRGLSVYITEVK